MYKQLNILFYIILILGVTFALIFYDFIDHNIGFSYIDELYILLLFCFYILKFLYFKKISKEYMVCIGIFVFYLTYSFFISINTTPAVIMDFFIQIKPYIAFYTIYSLPIELTEKQKRNIRIICVLFTIYLLIISLMGIETIAYTMGHPSRVATAISVLAFLYFYCTKGTKKDLLVMFLILSVGLLSFRYKMFGFFLVSIFFIYFYNIKINFKLSLRTILYALLIATFIFIILYDKIYSYVVVGSDEENLWARTALYINSINVLNTYLPFGSGFGTYATWASGVYYSPLYYELNLDKIYGITPEESNFVADTFFPVLAQFGYVGIFLFIIFWKRIYDKAKQSFKRTANILDFKISLLILIFFLIESLADSTFTNNRGAIMMMILALYLSKSKFQKKTFALNYYKNETSF